MLLSEFSFYSTVLSMSEGSTPHLTPRPTHHPIFTWQQELPFKKWILLLPHLKQNANSITAFKAPTGPCSSFWPVSHHLLLLTRLSSHQCDCSSLPAHPCPRLPSCSSLQPECSSPRSLQDRLCCTVSSGLSNYFLLEQSPEAQSH